MRRSVTLTYGSTRTTILAHRNCVIATPIIDRYRFPDDSFPQPAAETIDGFIDGLRRDEARYDEVAALFDDDHSPRLLKELLVFRALGPHRYALPLSTGAFIDQYAEERRYRLRPTQPVLGWPQSVFRIEFLGESIEVDVWDGNITATFVRMVECAECSAGSRVSMEGTLECRTLTIDDLTGEKELQHVDFIKMDIEGHEQAALMGAAATIAEMRPKLAISAYHRHDDLIELPPLLRRLNPGYRLYLEHYTNHSEETVLYAC